MSAAADYDVVVDDPKQQERYLRQLLRHDKRPLGLLLGAGCPTAIPCPDDAKKPLIPDMTGLTERVHARLMDSPCKESYEQVLAHFKEDGKEDYNVETVLSHVRLLGQVCGKREARGLRSGQLDDLEKQICTTIHGVMNVLLPGSSTPYHGLAAWLVSRQRKYPVEIFTTNYDLLAEQALEDLRVPYFDGFVGAREPFFDAQAMDAQTDNVPVLPQWTRLWKLHGSINWRRKKANKGPVFRVGVGDYLEGYVVVIHPSHMKYDESRKMPYLALSDHLRSFLQQPSAALVSCGYSFGDEHLNGMLLEGLRSNATAVMFGLMFDSLSEYPAAKELAQRHGNLTLLANDCGMIGTRERTWLKLANGAEETAAPDSATTFSLGDFRQFGDFVRSLVDVPPPIKESDDD